MRRFAILAILAICVVCNPASGQLFQRFPVPNTLRGGYDITVGPDGALWFTVPQLSLLGRSTTSGDLSGHSIQSPTPQDIASVGTRLWFTSQPGRIGSYSPSTLERTEFVLPNPNTTLSGIAVGPDSSVWFTEAGGSPPGGGPSVPDRIGRLSPTGQLSEFPLPTLYVGQPRFPRSICAGPDGNMWFTVDRAVGRITASGNITEYSTITSDGNPTDITAGPDGNLWFTFDGNDTSIFRITPAGLMTRFATPTHGANPSSITVGPDGALWFLESSNIGRITTDGQITEYPIPDQNSNPKGITTGPDGALWFTTLEFINRLDPAPQPPELFSLTPIQGPQSGGQTVTLVGRNLANTVSVLFGDAAGTVISSTPTTATVRTPIHAVGLVDVKLFTLAGASLRAGAYRFVAVPTITDISPLTGPATGGTNVTIRGSGFTQPTSVRFGAATSPDFSSPTIGTITALTPPGTIGSVGVSVSFSDGQSASAPAPFTYVCNVLITTQPQSQTITKGQSVFLVVVATGSVPLTYEWYEGYRGNTSKPITTAFANSVNVTPLASTRFWVRVRSECSFADSEEAVVAIAGTRRRATRH